LTMKTKTLQPKLPAPPAPCYLNSRVLRAAGNSTLPIPPPPPERTQKESHKLIVAIIDQALEITSQDIHPN
jgi:hypothetical protein